MLLKSSYYKTDSKEWLTNILLALWLAIDTQIDTDKHTDRHTDRHNNISFDLFD